ncbi:MAG: carbohydrate kinase family protein [Woeseia sp.]
MPETRDSVCCIGGMTLDRVLRLQQPAVRGTSNPVSGRLRRGGVARNVAENLARLSVSCSLVSIVGNDDAGRILLNETAALGVDTGLVQKSLGKATGSCTRAIEPDGELFISFADMEICDAMDRSFIQNCWLQISNAGIVFADTNLSAGSLSYLITGCREDDVRLVIGAVSTTKARRLPLNLNGVDILVCNRAEARAMLGDDIARDLEGMSKAICQRGATSAVVTAGSDGICFASDGQCLTLPAASIRPVDVSGAGDALIAGILFGRLKQYDFVTSLRIGQKAAAMTLVCEEPNSPELSAESVTEGLQP